MWEHMTSCVHVNVYERGVCEFVLYHVWKVARVNVFVCLWASMIDFILMDVRLHCCNQWIVWCVHNDMVFVSSCIYFCQVYLGIRFAWEFWSSRLFFPPQKGFKFWLLELCRRLYLSHCKEWARQLEKSFTLEIEMQALTVTEHVFPLFDTKTVKLFSWTVMCLL